MNMICPNCKTEAIFDTGFYWLVNEDEKVTENDMLVRCGYCWSLFTIRYLKSVINEK